MCFWTGGCVRAVHDLDHAFAESVFRLFLPDETESNVAYCLGHDVWQQSFELLAVCQSVSTS